jgi:hypothetical protein
MRILAALVGVLALTACTKVQPQAEEGAVAIECALGPGSEFLEACEVERSGEVLVIRNPDGSFRRFDASSFGALDGADMAQVDASEGLIEVTVAQDRYRWPAGTFGSE